MESQELQDPGTLEQVYPYSPLGSSVHSSEDERNHSSDSDQSSDSSGDEGPDTSATVGRMIARTFDRDIAEIPIHGDGDDTLYASTHDYDYDEESGSETSSVEEPGSPVSPPARCRAHDDGSYLSSTDEEGEDGEEEDEEVVVVEKEANPDTLPIRENGGVEGDTVMHEAAGLATPDTDKHAAAVEVSFAELQEKPFASATFLLIQSCERAQWRVLELEEIKQTVEKELAEATFEQESLERQREAKYQDHCRKRERLGISEELWGEYQAFCESMEPGSGSAHGYAITCPGDHDESYVKYDPEFKFFKRDPELPWDEYNFRCEATGRRQVEFWPVLYPGPDIEDASTWGDLYPRLYELAAKAARDGSEAAIDMLVALPDQGASFKGGWLFEYSPANPDLSPQFPGYTKSDAGRVWTQHPVQSRRWAYRSAHKVDDPEKAKARQKRMRRQL
ncbi:hypothetical protein F5Y14DRAFT_452127 [Nemania sp. NC0429]|nr:hypothetical protein F5Y14DRAFT_452127 [Nemania sp. NC0429]